MKKIYSYGSEIHRNILGSPGPGKMYRLNPPLIGPGKMTYIPRDLTVNIQAS